MYNSDGYVMIDMSDVDLTRSSQNIPGIYKRVLEVIDTNKLALIVNAGNNTPMAAVVHKKLNYYKITTLLYIFTINTNDIVIVEESGEATVDVEIVPTLTEGTKIADFSIGAVEGELFAPPQETEINDNVTAVNSTWSSSKINTELEAKADTGDLAAVATSGSYTDLSNKPTIPVLTDLIDDTTTSQDTVWSSDKTAAEIAAGAGVTIDDTTTSLTKTWSSDKINSELSDKADTSTTYTKTEVDTALSGKVDLIPIELTFNSHSNITIFRNQSYKIGKLVILSCVLKVEGNIANGDNILTSLPTMAKMTNYQGRLRFPKIIGNDEYFGSPSDGLNISDNTTVLTNFGAITATTTNPKYIFININYVTSD